MANEIVSQFSFDPGSSTQKIGSVRAEIRQLREALLEIPKDSPDWAIAFQRYAELSGRMREVNRLAKAVDPTERINGFLKIGEAGVGAFGAMRGAANLFGIANENVLKNLEQVESAMAVLRGLKAFDEGLKSARAMLAVLRLNLSGTKAVAVATKEQTAATEAQTVATEGATVATKGFGLAFKAIGIGLIISAIAYLVSNFDDIKKTVTDAFPALKNIGDIFDKLKEIAFGVGNVLLKFVVGPIKLIVDVVTGHFSKAISDAKEMFNVTKNFAEGAAFETERIAKEHNKEMIKEEIAQNERLQKIMEARGQDTYEIEKKTTELRKQLFEKGSKEFEDAQLDQEINQARHEKEVEDRKREAAKKAEEERKAQQKKIEEEEKKEQENEERAALEHQKRLDKIAADAIEEKKKDMEDELKASKDALLQQEILEEQKRIKGGPAAEAAYQKSLADIKRKGFEDELNILRKYGQDTSSIEKQIADNDLAITRKEEEERKKAIELAQKNILALYKTTFQKANDDRTISFKQRSEIEDSAFQKAINDTNITEETKTQLEHDHAEARKQLAKQEADAKKAAFSAASNLLNQASELLGKNTASAKAAASAATIISTYQSAQAAFTGMVSSIPGPIGIGLGIAAAAAAVVAGIARVKAIENTKVPAGAPGTSSNPIVTESGGGINLSAPSIPQQQNVTSLSNNSVNAVGSAVQQQGPIQAVVSETSISNTQNRVSSYQEGSSW